MSGERTPIALLVDDSCPIVHVFRDHWIDVHKKPGTTADGRPLAETIPNAFLDRFCDVAASRGIRGKFTIVPAPAAKGDVVQGIAGDPAGTRAWLDTAQRRLGKDFDFCPEMTTHNLTLDLASGALLDEGEADWSQHQDRTALTPYIAHALRLLRDAGVDCTGVTSPWMFGERVVPEYEEAIVAAQREVYGREFSWYFLHLVFDKPSQRPWVPIHRPGATLVAIPATVTDHWWATIDSPRTDDEFLDRIVDRMLSADGRSGDIAKILAAGGWPVVLTHWQSLFSNGLETGLQVLDRLGERVRRVLGDRVEWLTCGEMMRFELTTSAVRLRQSPG